MDQLDRVLAAEAARHDQVVDLRPGTDQPPEGDTRSAMIARMRKLGGSGSHPPSPAQWRLWKAQSPPWSLGERAISSSDPSRTDRAHIERSIDYAYDGSRTTDH